MKTVFHDGIDCDVEFTCSRLIGLLPMSSIDCLVTKFNCFSTLQKHLRIITVFHLLMMESKFSVNVAKSNLD